jgi:glycosyltransferase involved in cell wall biosynthesis
MQEVIAELPSPRTGADGTPRVAYVMSRFPKITETFVLYEILELERNGVAVEVFPLLRERTSVVHPEALRLMPRVRFLPTLSPAILAAIGRRLRRDPVRLLRALAEALWGTRHSLNFLFGALGIFAKTVKMAEEMETLGIRHVHAHFASHPALAALIIHRLTGIPFSFTAHGSDIHIDQTMFDTKLRAARFAVTVCRYNVDFLAEKFGDWVRDRLRVIHTGTDTESFAYEPPPDRTGRAFTILCVGALREVKGHRVLIDACALLRERGIDLRCRLIGEGELQRDLEWQIHELGLWERVHLLGARPRAAVAAEMRAADVVLLPSILGQRGDREGIPVCLMEAMATGRPVISSRQSGIPELVEHEVEGLLCPPGDPVALADALQRLAGDEALCRRLGAAGRDKVLREFDMRACANTLAVMLAEGGGRQ